ncbi:MAG: Uma2 family endonuclease [Gammaproteobacteria bacterium]|nr:Uma2 family endonuclease [Gammaproteobacteria bacterium]
MEWQEVCEHPSLRNLPFKIELNEKGQILMSPVKVYHSAFQGKIARLLPEGGIILPECAIKTVKGTKVADIAWASRKRFKRIRQEAECSIAPEICIEVLSSSNTDDEMEEKRSLYTSSGAKEFWVCGKDGKMIFFNKEGKIEKSALAPGFPGKVKIL